MVLHVFYKVISKLETTSLDIVFFMYATKRKNKKKNKKEKEKFPHTPIKEK